MRQRQPARSSSLPRVWLVSDLRNDAMLEHAIARLPRGSGLIYRHYHLAAGARRRRFERLRDLAQGRGHLVALAADARTARRWKADGAYGPAARLGAGPALLRLVTAHSLREIGRAGRADAVVLSPVFPTRSHPGAGGLGPLRFRLLARNARHPVIALGGMTRRRARRLDGAAWAAIDGLSRHGRLLAKDS